MVAYARQGGDNALASHGRPDAVDVHLDVRAGHPPAAVVEVLALRVADLVDRVRLREEVADHLRLGALAATDVRVVLLGTVLRAHARRHAVRNDADVVIPSALGDTANVGQRVKRSPNSVGLDAGSGCSSPRR